MTAAWKPGISGIGAPNLDESRTTREFPLGAITTAQSPTYGMGEFIYLQGVASTVVGSVVTYSADDYSTTLAAADAIGPVATALSACVANEFGWYQIGGKGVAKVAASFADDAACYLTSTAGTIDDAVVAGDRIKGMRGASAIDTPSTGLAEVEMSRPFVDDIAD